MNLNEFFNHLASDNSRNFKLAELESRKDDVVLRKAVFLALDPFTNFYIRKIPAYTPKEGEGVSLKFALDTLIDLSKRIVTGNRAIDYLKSTLEAVNINDAKVIERVIKKDLKCGVSISTANTVWPNLIHDYPCMLCSAFDKKLVDKIKFPALVQKKEDGMRFNAIVVDGTVDFRSRNGKEIALLGNLEEDFLALANGRNVVFDGELLVEIDGQIADRQTGNGILNKANKGTISALEASMVRATVWDMINYADFKAGVSDIPYIERWTTLLDSPAPSDKISFVETIHVATLEAAETQFRHYLEDGFEGIILKDPSAIWENKRSKKQVKFKGEEECDLKVVGIQSGTGKYEGMIGALLCESADGVLKVDVGSGFKDDDRKKDVSEYLGKIVAVKYNMRIKNKQGEESLFLPVFIEVREDKDAADSIGDIK